MSRALTKTTNYVQSQIVVRAIDAVYNELRRGFSSRKCTLQIVQRKLKTVPCTLFSEHSTVYSKQGTQRFPHNSPT